MRTMPPKLIGRLNEPEGAFAGWEILVWQLPNGGTRLTAEKAAVVPELTKHEGELTQLPLAYVTGEKV